jgi:hypothetical protein
MKNQLIEISKKVVEIKINEGDSRIHVRRVRRHFRNSK